MINRRRHVALDRRLQASCSDDRDPRCRRRSNASPTGRPDRAARRRRPSPSPDFAAADAFVWHPAAGSACSRSPRSTASSCRCSRASTGCATSCSTTPSASPAACRPTTCCSGARAAWARARWSRRCMPSVNRMPASVAAAEADRDPPRGHRDPARADGAAPRRAATASSCSATTSPSTATTPPTSR